MEVAVGIDYDGVGGIGIELTPQKIDLLISRGFFSQEEWEEDYYNCVEKIGIGYYVAGNAYCEILRFYLLVEEKNLAEIMQNYLSFLDEWKTKTGEDLSAKDLLVISDLYIS